jgi:endogenous inhibitor of DNA gyrase (YacG/DUF329 family)
MPDREKTPTQRARCPICNRPSIAEFRPFCSRRCADADLSRWLTGDYRIPGPANEQPLDDDSE